MVDTVLIDQEMVYAPRLSNDRLLLGLKRSLNEYELDLLRQRSVEARGRRHVVANYFRRHQWVTSRRRIGVWKKIRTCGWQQVIVLVFRKFMELKISYSFNRRVTILFSGSTKLGHRLLLKEVGCVPAPALARRVLLTEDVR